MFKFNFIYIPTNYNRVFECDLILIKHNSCDSKTTHTLYFYCKKENYLITIESTSILIETLIENNDKTEYGLYLSISFLIKYFKAKISKIIILNCSCCQIYIEHKFKQFQIHIALEDALILAKLDNCKMYMTENIISDFGIKITKELLEKALNSSD
ncbi:hypothetical protein A3F07_02090 [candidate division WWE3 bacterium RIFCSPHIGHO2_12_FULL_38_15]|uniref:BFN domain-containing protein n=1 Tax=candidate division WWE3 bacterium RIFCSPHIGHO2_02_FULL_38_14 TaxID=1802620 RepID=A0A1F4V936_UNCKA|nr:MAG: hypothetical protein A2793_03325 [candidate division WWE3 bacterium RIFCSPHIGHO2_01_FULL_38_45]OGC48671.1 MAG: hypothetical protein A3F07_02090 [candidate division WWE3 bacterium RIFCSPHIGHO2_12_FULL_38_15]OGC53077.1 MAG: hypothetical protein A3B64_01350 [candidate division WWE3 bacterium RIFCSPLOWO2_01_FULL_37_24]OGC53440.1 MAG: hypothetical protein A3D91_00205 [candidate division WWE3 bacterium RIFCSPHIGHO2_02_FULL_38_14]HLB51914.1 hypothetical protein [Patescibacteria group bacterium